MRFFGHTILCLCVLLGVSVISLAQEEDPVAQLANLMDEMNLALEGQGANYRVAMAEALVSTDSQYQGITLIAGNVGNKQLSSDFVPFDARRSWSLPDPAGEDSITYAVDTTGDAVPVFGGLTGAQTDAAIDRAMGTWDGASCSFMPIIRNPDFGIDIGVIAFLNGLGGSPFVFADIQHAGWRDIDFVGGVIGATFTFIFVSGGVPTDIDSNGLTDTAFREIYYDPSFNWADDGVGNVDVETVALHEAGHGLSQAHFGNVFIVQSNGTLHAAPRAVMNAVYLAPQRDLLGTDNGGHCSIWGEWPQN